MIQSNAHQIVLYLLLVALAGCEPWPRDPNETTRMITDSGVLRVAIIHNPPWTDVSSRPPSGREVELARNFARHLKATPEWHYLDLHESVKALEHGDVDLLIGGLVNASPYAKHAAFTRPYEIAGGRYQGERRRHVLAVRRGENRFLLKLEAFLKQEFPQHPQGS